MIEHGHERVMEFFDERRDIVYEDNDFFVVNKVAGLYTHRNHENHQVQALADLIAHKVEVSDDGLRHGIVHRLDKDTTGLLICAKRIEVKEAFRRIFKRRAITKLYWALVKGLLYEGKGEIITGIERAKHDRIKRAVVPTGEGKLARTQYTALEFYKAHTLLEVKLLTGRTHQIRLHLSHIGHSILGDVLYGTKHKDKPREQNLYLLAKKLIFNHPMQGNRIEIELPVPEFFQTKIEMLRDVSDIT